VGEIGRSSTTCWRGNGRGWRELACRRLEASDLAQEAWLRAWRKLKQFHGGPDDAQTLALFRAWIARIVECLGLNSLRDRQAQRRRPPGGFVHLKVGSNSHSPEPAADGEIPSALVSAREQARLVREALEQLPDEADRVMLRARFFKGLSLRQIAQRQQRHPEEFRRQFNAALRRLERLRRGSP
jgi:RNA polymerase sigma factor (sigma-70 family)